MSSTQSQASLQPIVALYQARRLAEAEAALRAQARELDMVSEFHRLAGIVAADLGKSEEARTHFARAFELAPDDLNNVFNLAEINRVTRRLPEAAELLRRLTAREPRAVGAHMALAGILMDTGDPAGAAASFAHAMDADPRNVELHRHIANTLDRTDRLSEAIVCRQRLAALAPGDFDNTVKLRNLYTRVVPIWHFPMMNDAARNDAYDRAIRRAVTPGMHVLDIGTGAGLLSMMAARAGAGRVTTCEMVPEIAAMARQILAANGLADRVDVIAKASTDMAVGVDMPDRADLLVSEVLSSELLAENVVETVAHARAHLVKPGARMIPRAVSVMAALVGGADLASAVSVDRAAGFDLSLFNAFSPSVISILMDSSRYELLSDDWEVFRFDLTGTIPARDAVTHALPIRRPGTCVGVLQWIRLYLDDETVFENRPTPARQVSGWRHMLFTAPRLVAVAPGQTATVEARHARSSIAFMLREVR